jgi:hypothetical protein
VPKLVDYASRYEFLRQAAFALVREEGVHALTRRAVAARLGCGLATVCRLVDPSAELATLAADEVCTRRRAGRWGRLPEDPVEAASALMHRLLPDDASRIDEELVWLRLVACRAAAPPRGGAALTLRHDFQIAERGWSDVDPIEADDEGTVSRTDTETGPGTSALARHFADRRREVDVILGRVMDLLEVEDRDAESVRLRALVDGLTLAACLGQISPEECVQAMDRHLAGLRQPPVRVAG